jgi:hypothetical protein
MLRALNGNSHLQQFRILFITGIRSGVLGRLDRGSIDLIVRRAFTSVQLRTILEENHHLFLIVEHRPNERARDMARNIAQALKQASRVPPPLRPCIGPAPGSHGRADRVFCFYDMQGAGLSRNRRISEEMAGQTTWEAFS